MDARENGNSQNRIMSHPDALEASELAHGLYKQIHCLFFSFKLCSWGDDCDKNSGHFLYIFVCSQCQCIFLHGDSGNAFFCGWLGQAEVGENWRKLNFL